MHARVDATEHELESIGKPVDNFEAGVGIASGGTDPRSTNETFDDTLRLKTLRWITLIFNIRTVASKRLGENSRGRVIFINRLI